MIDPLPPSVSPSAEARLESLRDSLLGLADMFEDGMQYRAARPENVATGLREAADMLVTLTAQSAALTRERDEARRLWDEAVNGAWDDVLRVVQRAWPEPQTYGDCPTELIARVIDERDEMEQQIEAERGAFQKQIRLWQDAKGDQFQRADRAEVRAEAAESALAQAQQELADLKQKATP